MSVLNCAPRLAVSATVLLVLNARILTAQSAPALDPAAVRAALIPRINDGTFRGISTAWREGGGIQTASAGVRAAGGTAINPTTRFQLGEAGAVFTAALLADLVVKGEVSLDDLAQRFLPPPVRLPTRHGRAITLGDLAFHRSGLTDRRVAAGRTPIEGLDRAVRSSPLRFDIGSRYAFSQLGIDILGLALSRHLRLPLASAIQSRILAPLEVTDVVLASSRPLAGLDAIGHAANGRPVGASARSEGVWLASIASLARFAVAASDTVNGPLAGTFALMMRTRSPGPDPSLPVALGWRVLRLDGRDIYWHDAQDARGFSVYIAMDPQRSRAAAVLSNTERAVDAIAGQLLLGRVPLISSSSSDSGTAPRPSPAKIRRTGQR
jgi:serine-type D-Ala-D-Ala carboxypeptidase/endopeptidase